MNGDMNIFRNSPKSQPGPALEDFERVMIKSLSADPTSNYDSYVERIRDLKKFIETWNILLQKGWIRLLNKNLGSVTISKPLMCEERILTLLLACLLPTKSKKAIYHGMGVHHKTLDKVLNESNPCKKTDHHNEHIICEYLLWRLEFPTGGSDCAPESLDPLFSIAQSEVRGSVKTKQIFSLAGKKKEDHFMEIFKFMISRWHDSNTADVVIERPNNKGSILSTEEMNIIEFTPDARISRTAITALNIFKAQSNDLHETNDPIKSHLILSEEEEPYCLSPIKEIERNEAHLILSEEESHCIIRIPSTEEVDLIESNMSDSITSAHMTDFATVETYVNVPPTGVTHLIGPELLSPTAETRVERTGNNIQDFSARMFGTKENHISVTEKLMHALRDKEGWRKIVILADNEEFYELISKEQVLQVFKTLTMFHYACNLTLSRKMLWLDALQETVNHYQYSGLGIFYLRKKFQEFRKHNYMLPHPNSLKVDSNGKVVRSKETFFLDIYPDLKRMFQTYARENIRRISVDLMHLYVNDTIIPFLKEEIVYGLDSNARTTAESDDIQEDTINKIIQKQHGFQNGKVGWETVRVWMKNLGYTFGKRKKMYYVDKHEDHAEYRTAHIEKRFSDELFQPVWVQKTRSEFQRLKDKGILANNLEAHTYLNTAGEEMVEFHIDCDNGDTLLREFESSIYGGNFSVRNQQVDKKVILFGHDESAMKQHQFTTCSWTLEDGQAALVPKHDGAGIMYSLFVSRITGAGFGSFLTAEVLAQVNANRCGEKYLDEDAAIAVHGQVWKEPLLSDPAVRSFQFGGENGYWKSEHVIIQTEDCIDVCKVAFSDCKPHFLFDNSTGHCKGRKDGLNVNNMNKNFGGAQKALRPSKITAGCLGPFDPKLQPGEMQSFVFGEQDEGPFYLSEHERILQREDSFTNQRKVKKLTIAELRIKLNEIGVISFGRRLRKDLVDLAANHGISDTISSERTVVEGWLGKPKGMFQVAWERGWIDPTQVSKYQVEAPCDAFGVEDTSFSLKEILSNCDDFMNEIPQLQYIIESLGGFCQMSPKYHPEIAGEGIENLWGFIKKVYRSRWSIRDSANQKKEDFLQLIAGIMDGSDGTLTKTAVRKCARRARQYMLAYSWIKAEKEKKDNVSNQEDGLAMSYLLIEKTVKLLRARASHRSAMDFDFGFLGTLHNVIPDALLEEA